MEQKFRPTFVEIDIQALKENFQAVKKYLPNNSEILGVVKANAYGHGAINVANALVSEGINSIGVAILEEALELRNAGIKAPIVILTGIEPSQYSEVVKNRLTPVLWQKEIIQGFHDFLKKNDLSSPIFLKVDTGMHRLGISYDDFPMICKLISALERYKIECLMSHFAISEDPDDALTKNQVELFNKAIAEAREFGLNFEKVGINNSGGIINRLFDKHSKYKILVRPGILLYGSPPVPELEAKINLKPVMHFKTAIVDIKKVKSGESVGYCASYKARDDMKVAILPVGYADGYHRGFSNKASVLINGKRAAVIGNISMDLTIVDISSIPTARIGDEVVLIGKQNKEFISAWELAKHINSISYEIFTSVSARVPRIIKT